VSAALRFEMLEVLGQPRPSQWARVWPTSVAVSRWLLAQVPASLPTHATELGCGMGLVSVMLSHLGLVTSGTDREPLALAFATENVARNGVVGFTASRLDWSEPDGTSTQLLLASDIAYEEESPARLFALIDGAGLLGAGGRLVLGVPQARCELADELVARLCDQGYAHHEERRVVEWESRAEEIALHVLRRAPCAW
jgi:predicted nicotinamide N-methyase